MMTCSSCRGVSEGDCCAICQRDLCAECQVTGCCGEVPARSGFEEELDGDHPITDPYAWGDA